MPKTYADTYLFRSYSEYEKKLFEFVMGAQRVDVNDSAFEDVLFDFKRRTVSDKLVKVMKSNNVVLGIFPGKSLPKAFKVFVMKDVKEDKDKFKVFVDVTGVIEQKGSSYTCNHIDWLTAYMVNAMTSFIYKMQEIKLVGNASVIKDGGAAFAKCFTYIIDRMYKISSVQQLRNRVSYAAAVYYQVNLLGKNFDKQYDSIKANAIKISGIDPKDSQVVDIMIEDKDYVNIDTFVKALGKVFNLKDLKTSNVASMWMQCFGTGTVFGLEYFPAFSMMMTNTYVGGYIDQQATIEKVAGTSMVAFTKTILQIGASA